MCLHILLVARCLQINKLRPPWSIIQVITEEHRAKPHPGGMQQCPRATPFVLKWIVTTLHTLLWTNLTYMSWEVQPDRASLPGYSHVMSKAWGQYFWYLFLPWAHWLSSSYKEKIPGNSKDSVVFAATCLTWSFQVLSNSLLFQVLLGRRVVPSADSSPSLFSHFLLRMPACFWISQYLIHPPWPSHHFIFKGESENELSTSGTTL